MEEIKLVIKKIPTKFLEKDIKDILNNCIKGDYYNFQYVKPSHKYDFKNNNICFLTVKNLDTRLKLTKFLEEFDIINKKGTKHHLEVGISVIQTPSEVPIIPDNEINNTYEGLLHFQKFKEHFEADDLIKFKMTEGIYDEGIFSGVKEKEESNEANVKKSASAVVSHDKKEDKKKIMIKQRTDDSYYNQPNNDKSNNYNNSFKNNYHDNYNKGQRVKSNYNDSYNNNGSSYYENDNYYNKNNSYKEGNGYDNYNNSYYNDDSYYNKGYYKKKKY